jgi:hypothetical protein
MLIDSDVLIWMMRGHSGAAARLQSILPWRISVVPYIELAQGCRNKLELTQATQAGVTSRGHTSQGHTSQGQVFHYHIWYL